MNPDKPESPTRARECPLWAALIISALALGNAVLVVLCLLRRDWFLAAVTVPTVVNIGEGSRVAWRSRGRG